MLWAMTVSDEKLEDALYIAAYVVERYGDKFWPIFERLEKELHERRSRAERLAAYRPVKVQPQTLRLVEKRQAQNIQSSR